MVLNAVSGQQRAVFQLFDRNRASAQGRLIPMTGARTLITGTT
ncbi:hypothetical protein [Gimesia chilikensis]|nr:hypothetical protein [Gimesia chilikensis]